MLFEARETKEYFNEIIKMTTCQPDRIDTKWIGLSAVNMGVLGVQSQAVLQNKRSAVRGGELVGDLEVGSKDVEALGEDVVVDESGVDSADAHHEHNVASAEEDLEYL